MSIENEISQKKFVNKHQKAGINLMYTQNWVFRKIKNTLSEFNVSPQQYNVLRILRGASPEIVSASYIQERMIDRDSNITRLIDKLLKKEMVTRPYSNLWILYWHGNLKKIS